MFTFGIEHEVAFFNRAGQFADFVSTSFAEFNTIIADLPLMRETIPNCVLGMLVSGGNAGILKGLNASTKLSSTVAYIQRA